ncbi:MAG: hypothetical protein ABIR39_05685 [Nocardioides sp.]|uniref:hypothetical protein n=1 Tax=Nocardioides sp. TaxID=35761 RepID=UPI0032637721
MRVPEDREHVYQFMAMRFLAITCLLLLLPLALWSAVLGMAGMMVAVVWMATLGTRTASAWAHVRARGASKAEAATASGAIPAYVVMVVGVVSAVVIGAAVRHFSPVGEWLGAPGVAKPVVGALVLLLSGVPGMFWVLVVSRSERGQQLAGTEEEVLQQQPTARDGGVRVRIASSVAALGLGAVNVAVLVSITPLDQCLGGGLGQRALAGTALFLAFVAPTVAVWYVRRARVVH